MNIFYLSENPVTAARFHADTHVVKMILESAQMLCTIINSHAGEQVMPYKSTHKNHPCTLWASESLDNALWLVDLTRALNDEFKHRFNHVNNHKSFDMLMNNDIMSKLRECLADKGMTKPALAMPDEFKVSCPVESYRNYYRVAKVNLLKYTNQSLPEWL
jgi:hypothetical protein